MKRNVDIGSLQFDTEGFLLDPSYWNREVAMTIARNTGYASLAHDQWMMIAALRRYYFKYYSPPLMHYICHVSHFGPHCMETLFGDDACDAWRIAGLPNPGAEAIAYM